MRDVEHNFENEKTEKKVKATETIVEVSDPIQPLTKVKIKRPKINKNNVKKLKDAVKEIEIKPIPPKVKESIKKVLDKSKLKKYL